MDYLRFMPDMTAFASPMELSYSLQPRMAEEKLGGEGQVPEGGEKSAIQGFGRNNRDSSRGFVGSFRQLLGRVPHHKAQAEVLW